MGGCYTSECYSRPYSYSAGTPEWKELLKAGIKNGDRSKLTQAYKKFFLPGSYNTSGFIAEAAKIAGIQTIEKIPKEYSEFEYEVKFDINPGAGRGKEPSIEDYLNAFDFPSASNARFLKDPVNSIAEGINRFFGSDKEEKLVVITKGGKNFLKEKGEVIPLDVNVPYQELVIKRTENRYPAEIDKVTDKISELTSQDGIRYRGRIRKEKGDAFILDANDGRIYSFTITRAHLIKAGEEKESDIQRQLEIEYAGFIPGFANFEKNSEKQIVEGMVTLAAYTVSLYHSTPLVRGWTFKLMPTNERKYDFVAQIEKKKGNKLPKLKQLEKIALE